MYENSLAVYLATFAQPKRRSARQPNRSAAGLRLDLSSEKRRRNIVKNYTVKRNSVKVLTSEVCTQKLESGNKGQGNTLLADNLPLTTEPGRAGFGGVRCALEKSFSAGQFQALGDNLFATARNHATADHQAHLTKAS